MSKISEEVQVRINQIEEVICIQEAEARKEPEGRLRISRTNGHCRYYLLSNNKKTDSYLKKDQFDTAKKLAQKDYRQKVLRSLRQEKELLEKLNAFYAEGVKDNSQKSASDRASGSAKSGLQGSTQSSIQGSSHRSDRQREDFFYGPEELIRAHLREERRILTESIVQDEEEFVAEWLAAEYERKPFRDDAPEYFSNNNVQMRSKSEVIIAGLLEKYGVPFHYEKPLYLDGFVTVHPDFTVLNVRTRKTMYWEHMGMMDDPEYLDHALEKIHRYEKAGFFPGTELILTHETSERPLQTRIIENVIEKYLL